MACDDCWDIYVLNYIILANIGTNGFFSSSNIKKG